VTLSSPVNTSTTSVWEYPDGTQRILNRGYAAGTVTNTDDGISATHNGGFRSEVVIHPDGSVDVSVRGTFFAWYLEGDPVVGLSAGLFAVHGNGSESYAPMAPSSVRCSTAKARTFANSSHLRIEQPRGNPTRLAFGSEPSRSLASSRRHPCSRLSAPSPTHRALWQPPHRSSGRDLRPSQPPARRRRVRPLAPNPQFRRSACGSTTSALLRPAQ
jgi:hypothetical protein